MITANILIALGAPAVKASSYASALESGRNMAYCSTPLRMAHFLAQTGIESAHFSRLEENLNYTDPDRLDKMFSAVQGHADAVRLIAAGKVAIGNRVYASRYGNGNEASGDGFKYRGRGWLQTTFKENYAAFEKATGIDVVENPDQLLNPLLAADAAAVFWLSHGCNAYADRDDLTGLTGAINGPALAGLEERRALLKKAKQLLGVDQ